VAIKNIENKGEKMKKIICWLMVICFVFLSSGCAYNGIVRISPDTYMVSKTGGAYSSTAALKTY